MPSAGAPVVSGSTSQILAAAFRGGSGSSSVTRRAAERARDSSHLTLAPSEAEMRPDRGFEPTRAVSLDDTQRTDEAEPLPGTAFPRRALKIVIGILATALVAALGALAVVLAS
jgi:hypothetical protein